MNKRTALITALAGVLTTSCFGVSAEEKKAYGPGVSDTEIKLGQTMPYSGPASAYSIQGVVQHEYFKRINAAGGVNGRKITIISLDDAYSPPKTVEQTRKLVEQENVLAMYGSFGTLTNSAVHRYLNSKKVPQVLIYSGASKWNEPQKYPWTLGFLPAYNFEAAIYAKYIKDKIPGAKIATLTQADDGGRDFLNGFLNELGDRRGELVVAEATYDATEPTVDSQMVKLKSSGANVFFFAGTSKFAAQAIRKKHEMGWQGPTFDTSVSASLGTVMKPAGLEAAQGVITATAFKNPTIPDGDKPDADVADYIKFMKEIGRESMTDDGNAVFAYVSAHLMHKVLQACGSELTRERLMKELSHLDVTDLPMLLPGVAIRTSPTNYSPYNTLMLQRVKGDDFELFGEPISIGKSN